MTSVAIVILNWNGKPFLEKFLPLLVKHTARPGVEIIVADNASSDDSVSWLEEHHANDTRLIKLDRNHGFAGGYNRALEQVEAEYYLLLNSDIEVTENWLDPLVECLDFYPEVAACSPVLADFNARDRYEYAGAAGGYIDRYGYTFCRGRIFDTLEEIDPSFTQTTEVFWTTGACMLVRSAAYRDAGGLDDHFFAHMEEVDLCWRMKNMGHKLAVVPASKVYHVGGGTLPKSNPFKTYLNYRNNLFLLYKNLPEEQVTQTIRTRMWLDLLSAIRFMTAFKLKDIAAIWRAHRDFRKKRADYSDARAQMAPRIKTVAHPEIYPGAIVPDYFLRGRKRFGDLAKGFGKKMDDRVPGTDKKQEE